jgi:hypothetical protein
MPKPLELHPAPPVIEGVLIKRASLHHALHGARLIRAARREASRIATQAEQAAADLRRQAYLQGYYQGVEAGAAALAGLLNDAGRLHDQLLDQVQAEVKAMLAAVLPQPGVVLALVDDWLSRHRERGMDSVEVRVPRAWHEVRQTLGQRFLSLPGARVEVHDGTNFVIRHGDLIYEFAPDAAAGAFERLTMRRIQQQALPEACARLAGEAWSALVEHTRPGRSGAHAQEDIQ